jgi:hypothetical protein
MLFFWLGVVVVYTCNNSTRESYPEGSYIGGHAGLHTEFEARLEYVASHCLKKKKKYIYIYKEYSFSVNTNTFFFQTFHKTIVTTKQNK